MKDIATREILNVVDYYLQDLSRGIARIQKGQVPDGSGDPIGDQTLSDIYFVLLGRPVDQVAHGAKRSGGNLTLASTTHASKGLIYFGNGASAASGMTYDETNHRLGIQTIAPTAYAHIKQIAGGGTQIVVPRDASGADSAGTWGLVGAATFGGALKLDDGAASYVQTGAGSDLDLAVRMASATAPSPLPTGSYTINVKARRTTTGGSLVNPISMIVSILNPDYSLGAGTIIAGPISIVTTGVATGAFTTFSYALASNEITALNHSNFWLNFRAGAGNTQTYDMSYVELQLPGVMDPVPLQMWQNTSVSSQLNYAQNLAGGTVLQVSGSPNINFASSMGVEIASGSPASGMIAFAANTDGLVRWASASGIATKVQHRFIANGPYRIDNDVDGAYIAPHALTMTTALLYRRAAGAAGTTSVNLLKNGVSMLSSQASVGATGGASATGAGTFSSTSVAAGDRLTVSASSVETGRPRDWVLLIEGY